MAAKRRSCKSFRISDILGHGDVDENENMISNKEKEISSLKMYQNFEQKEKLFEEKHEEKHHDYRNHGIPTDERYMVLSSRYEKELKKFEVTNGSRSPAYHYEHFNSPSYQNWLPWFAGAWQYGNEIDLNGTIIREIDNGCITLLKRRTKYQLGFYGFFTDFS